MKVLSLFAFVFPIASLGVVVSTLPFDAAVLSEAMTNVPFAVDFGTMSRIEFSLALDASPSNCVEVAIGTDADGDGSLGLDEADWTFGYNCDIWFGHETASGSQTEEEAPTVVGRVERTFTLKRPKMDAAWDLVRVMRRGVSEVGEVVIVEGKRPGVVIGIW